MSSEKQEPAQNDHNRGSLNGLDEALEGADALLEEGKDQEAFEVLGAIAERYPTDDASVFARGVILDRWERRDEAANAMEQALRRNPTNMPAAISLAGLRFEAGDAFAAMKTIRDAFETELEMDAPLAERFLVLKAMVEHDALEQLLIHFSQCEAGFCNDTVLRGIGRNVGVLIGHRIESCKPDPALKEGFLLGAEGSWFRAAVIDGVELVVMDSSDAVLLRRPLVLPRVEAAKLRSQPSSLPDGMVSVAFDFDPSALATRRLLEYVSVLSGFLGEQPDELYYEIQQGRRWDERSEFEPRAWKRVCDTLANARQWRLRARLDTKQYLIELEANSEQGGRLSLRSDPERIEKLRALHQKVVEEADKA